LRKDVDVGFICRNLKKTAPKKTACKMELLGQWDPQHELIIEDPYYVRFAIFQIPRNFFLPKFVDFR
jgi:hypothetical protein